MTLYSYKVKDTAGNTRTGTLEADDERHAAAMIREAGGLPMDIKPVRATVSPGSGSTVRQHLIDPLWTGVGIRALALFFRQMATLLAAGMSISEALRSAGGRTRGRLARIIDEAHANVQSGGQLSGTMSHHPRVFGNLPIALVRAGEAGGLLEHMVARVASYLEYEISIRQRLGRVIFYPCMIFLFIILTPHLPALILEGFPAFARSLWWSVRIWLPWVPAFVVAIKFVMQLQTARLIWDAIKLQPPVLGTMARKVAMSRFCRAIALLYSAGMPIAEALRVAADACANTYIGRSIQRSVPAIRAGEGLTETLTRTGVMMPMVLDMLSAGEKTGSLEPVLQKTADYMDEEVDSTIYKTGIALFVLMILAAGGMVLRMALGFYVSAASKAMGG